MGLSRLMLLFHVDDLVVLQMFLYFFLKYEQSVCEIHFKWTGVVGSGLHKGFLLRSYQRIRAEAHVKPLPKAAKTN